jgi:hypothetical protein
MRVAHNTCVYEDEPARPVMRKIFEQFPGRFAESVSIPCRGFGKIKKNTGAYNRVAKYAY